MHHYKSGKIIFIGSETSLLETLSRENETEVVSSVTFLSSLSQQFLPDLLVVSTPQNIKINELRSIKNLESTPLLIVKDSFNSEQELETLANFRNIIICNEIIVQTSEFLNKITKIIERKNSIQKSGTGLLIKKAIYFINQNYSKKITRNEIASFLDSNTDYLSRIFPREMGIGLWDYLMHMRLSKAEKLLKTTSKSISEISEECGFSTISYFDNTFKKYFGKTPASSRSNN